MKQDGEELLPRSLQKGTAIRRETLEDGEVLQPVRPGWKKRLSHRDCRRRKYLSAEGLKMADYCSQHAMNGMISVSK